MSRYIGWGEAIIAGRIGAKALNTDALNRIGALEAQMPTKASKADIGNLTDLTTEDKANIVRAINELNLTKAFKDGSYENLTSGNAYQLVATVGAEDKTPFNYRTAGGSVDIGDRADRKGIIGGTLGWNSLMSEHTHSQNGVDITVNDNVIEASGTAEALTLIRYSGVLVQNHVYAVVIDFIRNPNNYFVKQDGVGAIASSRLVKPTTNINAFYTAFGAGAEVDFKTRVSIHDITTIFGSTIADYIYLLDQATAGAGVAWFKRYFPKDYYAYNAGKLESVRVSEYDTTELNLWDEEILANSYLTETGELRSYNGAITAKNLIDAFPSTTYYLLIPESGLRVNFYDASENVLGTTTSSISTTFTTPANCRFIRFSIFNYGSETYRKDVNLNLHWDGEMDGTYEEFKLNRYPLDPTLVLRGMPKLDANNDLYYDGDVYESSGKVTRRYGIVDLGTCNYLYADVYGTGIYCFVATPDIPQPKEVGASTKPNNVCSKYVAIQAGWQSSVSYTQDKSICYGYNGWGTYPVRLIIRDTAYSDAATFKTAMSGVYLIYELDTPTEETADPYINPAKVNDFGTESFKDAGVEAGDRDVAIPVGHDTIYKVNLRAKVEMAPDSPDGDGTYVVKQTSGLNAYIPLNTWLGDNGYEKVEDVSAQITDVAGLTYSIKKAYKIGNIVTLTVYAQNSTGSDIAGGTTIMTLGSGIIPQSFIGAFCYNIGSGVGWVGIQDSGSVGLPSAFPIQNTKAITFSVSYAVA